MKEVTIPLKEKSVPSQEMVLNPKTKKWEPLFTYIQIGDNPTYVELGVIQRKFIENRVSTNLHTISEAALKRLHKILEDDKYTLSDRSWMNSQFHKK